MKRDRFWKKLLSLGLAAAMTVASLTGPGSATNPVEVKAAEKTSLAGARVALAGVDNVTEDGKTEYKPTSVTVTVSVVSGGAISPGPGEGDGGSSGGGDSSTTSPSAIQVAADDAETKNIEIPAASFESGKDGLKVAFYRGEAVTTDFIKAGTITVKVVPADANSIYTGEAQAAYEIKAADGTGTVETSAAPAITGEGDKTEFTSSLKVTITAAEGAKIYYTTDGTDPTVESTLYKEAITLTASTTVKAIAVEEGKNASAVVSKAFKKTADGSTGGSSGGSTGGSSGGSTGGSTTTPTTPPAGSDTTTTTTPDGTTVETKTETKADGTKVETVTETKAAGTQTVTVKETEKNASGKEVAVTTETQKDAAGNVTGEKKTSVIANAAKNTSATVTAVKDSKGNVTGATADVEKTGRPRRLR